MVEVLPAPLGPRTQVTRPACGRERQRVDRHHVAVGHAQRVDDDGRVHVGGRYPRPEPARETADLVVVTRRN